MTKAKGINLREFRRKVLDVVSRSLVNANTARKTRVAQFLVGAGLDLLAESIPDAPDARDAMIILPSSAHKRLMDAVFEAANGTERHPDEILIELLKQLGRYGAPTESWN